MALEISTIGIKLLYAAGADATTVPSTGFVEVKNITSIGEISASADQLDATDLSDEWRRYISGVKDGSGSVSIGANFTTDFKEKWTAAVEAYKTAFASQKAFWWEVRVPNFGSFFMAGEPSELGLPGIEVNQVLAGTVTITPNQIKGWQESTS